MIKTLMYNRTGVLLRPTKKPLVVSRLRKRLEELRLSDFTGYIKLLENPKGAEFEIFVNAITTNETYFFRHTKQFNFLFEHIFPAVMERKKSERHEVRIWSAACSTGEEPYSIAIACREFFKKYPDWQYKIFASDVNSDVLAGAAEARFPEKSMKEVPESLKSKYFKPVKPETGKAPRLEYALDGAVKKDVEFLRHNLLKPFAKRDIDIVFLRNVMIYFNRETKQKVVHLLQENIAWGGFLFVSLAESLSDIPSSLKFIETGIYQKTLE